jgi:hypothetical protein
MAKTNKYKVTLTASNQSGAKRTYYRGGVQFTVLEPQVLELTNEEVKVFKDDARLTVKGVSDKSESNESETVSESESDAPTTEADVTEEDSSTEDTDSEDSSSDEAEEVSDEAPEAPNVDSLLKLSRNELNAKASELNIENADKLETKTEVAEAIVNATS